MKELTPCELKGKVKTQSNEFLLEFKEILKSG